MCIFTEGLVFPKIQWRHVLVCTSWCEPSLQAKTPRRNQVEKDADTTGIASRCPCGVCQGMVQPLLHSRDPPWSLKRLNRFMGSRHRFMQNLYPSAQLIHQELSAWGRNAVDRSIRRQSGWHGSRCRSAHSAQVYTEPSPLECCANQCRKESWERNTATYSKSFWHNAKKKQELILKTEIVLQTLKNASSLQHPLKSAYNQKSQISRLRPRGQVLRSL